MSYGVGRRRGLDLVLLWLWCSSYSSDLTPSLGTSVGPKKQKKKKKKEQKLKKEVNTFNIDEICIDLSK